uniref:Uncharacterized protein n=1 Tax=Fagus sylvatica TaxID=28930 RepID=A0A2N9HPF0_FAGSY
MTVARSYPLCGKFGQRIVFGPDFKGDFGGLRIPAKLGKPPAKLRVARCSWSCHLSNAPELLDQLVVSRKKFVREGGCPRGKTRQIFSAFSLSLSMFARTVDLASDVGFRRSWYRWKACATLFLKVPGFAGNRAWAGKIWSREQRPPECFWSIGGHFPAKIPARPGKILAIREFHTMHERVLFPTCPGLQDQLVVSQEDSARKRGNVGGKVPEFSAQPYSVGLFSRAW